MKNPTLDNVLLLIIAFITTFDKREGEAIFRYIYNYLGCAKPFQRLWISSLTDKAIREGLDNLKDGADYDNLYQAAKARSEADWLVGINASQAISIAAGQGVFSLGRVQTPTLAMVCSRYLENKKFVPVPYWQHKLNVFRGENRLSLISDDKYDNLNNADSYGKRIYNLGAASVVSVDKKTVRQEPPLLYDLTTLQKEANSKHGFSADKTLQIAQELYESKVITYPRTGSRYLSEDVFETIPGLLENLHSHPVFGAYAKSLKTLNKRSIDDAKITDHHAIIVTENKAGGLSKEEETIYNMILCRMLEAFSDTCIKEQTIVKFDAGVKLFSAKGSVIVQAGWRAVQGVYSEENEEEDNSVMPEISEGEQWNMDSLEILEKQTKSRPLHTESSLLGAMETAGKILEDEEQRQALKDIGIGTPATRAAIIETLFSRDYMRREKKSLVPTEKGLAVYEAVKGKRIADVEMTGMWEQTFAKIESGEADAGNFRKGIEVYTAQITDELLHTTLFLPKQSSGVCPKCGNAVNAYPKVVKCKNEDCGFMLFPSLSGKVLPDDAIQTLLSGKQTGVIKGFKSKAGKPFEAALILDETYRIKFVFPPNKQGGNKPKKK